MKLKLAFFGTPDFAADLLEKLLTDKSLPVEVSFVVTQPDQPIGRKKIITPSAVKQIAVKHKIKVFDSLHVPRNTLHEVDLAIIYYYGEIIPAEFLSLPRLGFWNIHFSHLPRFRGATPATFSLIMGDAETAISLVQTDSKLDHGLLISQDVVTIDPDETRLGLEKKLHDKLPEILAREIANVHTLRERLVEQNHSQATYTLLPTKNHGFIPLSVLKKALQNEPLTPEELPSLIIDYLKRNSLDQLGQLEIRNSSKIIFDYFRGLHPWPGLWTLVLINGVEKRLKITDTSLVLHSTSYILHINRVHLEGKTEVDFEQFSKAYPIL